MRIENIVIWSLTIGSILFSLIAPVPVSQEYRLVVIALILLLFLSAILNQFNSRLDEQENEQRRMKEKLNIYERLSKIEAELNAIKKRKL